MDRSKDNSRKQRRRLPPWKRRRRKMLIFVGVPLAILAAFATWRVRLARKVDAQMAAIRQSGFPVTAEELNAWYTAVPEAENAALVYGKAFRAFKSISPKRMEDVPLLGFLESNLDEAYSESTKAHMVELLERNAETLLLLSQAAALPRSRYPADFSQGWIWNAPHLKAVETVTFLLCIRAMLAAEEGRGDEAADALCDALAAGRSLKNEPGTASQSWRARSHKVVLNALMRVLSRCTLTDSQALRLAQALGAEEDPQAAIRAWAGDRCYWTSGTRVEELRGRPENILIRGIEILGFLDLNLNSYLDISREVMATIGLPRHEGIRACLRLQKRVDNLPSYKRVWMAGSVGWALFAFARDEAALRGGRTALAIERYRQTLGALPEGLDDLVPAYLETVPEDPYDGQPLRYRVEEPGYLVYSVGNNRTDDGGKDRKDLVFRVKR